MHPANVFFFPSSLLPLHISFLLLFIWNSFIISRAMMKKKRPTLHLNRMVLRRMTKSSTQRMGLRWMVSTRTRVSSKCDSGRLVVLAFTSIYFRRLQSFFPLLLWSPFFTIPLSIFFREISKDSKVALFHTFFFSLCPIVSNVLCVCVCGPGRACCVKFPHV